MSIHYQLYIKESKERIAESQQVEIVAQVAHGKLAQGKIELIELPAILNYRLDTSKALIKEIKLGEIKSENSSNLAFCFNVLKNYIDKHPCSDIVLLTHIPSSTYWNGGKQFDHNYVWINKFVKWCAKERAVQRRENRINNKIKIIQLKHGLLLQKSLACQKKLNKCERQASLQNAFMVGFKLRHILKRYRNHGASAKGGDGKDGKDSGITTQNVHIYVLDDVKTTGSSLKAGALTIQNYIRNTIDCSNSSFYIYTLSIAFEP